MKTEFEARSGRSLLVRPPVLLTHRRGSYPQLNGPEGPRENYSTVIQSLNPGSILPALV
jgi:hypothetical protein